MDLELIFWLVAGGLAFLFMLLVVTIGRTPEEVEGIPIPEKNVDDMEDRWEWKFPLDF